MAVMCAAWYKTGIGDSPKFGPPREEGHLCVRVRRDFCVRATA
jgi:hypothetical protein